MIGFVPESWLRSKSFVLSFVGGFAASIAFVSALGYYIALSRIPVQKIGEVTFLPAQNSQEARPISELSAATNRGDSHTIWAGYAANLKSVCDAGDLSTRSNKDAIVLVPFTATISAATIQLQPNICGRVRSSESIFLTSDRPFPNVASEKKYFQIDKTK
jgi:hypothetical protein